MQCSKSTINVRLDHLVSFLCKYRININIAILRFFHHISIHAIFKAYLYLFAESIFLARVFEISRCKTLIQHSVDTLDTLSFVQTTMSRH